MKSRKHWVSSGIKKITGSWLIRSIDLYYSNPYYKSYSFWMEVPSYKITPGDNIIRLTSCRLIVLFIPLQWYKNQCIDKKIHPKVIIPSQNIFSRKKTALSYIYIELFQRFSIMLKAFRIPKDVQSNSWRVLVEMLVFIWNILENTLTLIMSSEFRFVDGRKIIRFFLIIYGVFLLRYQLPYLGIPIITLINIKLSTAQTIIRNYV